MRPVRVTLASGLSEEETERALLALADDLAALAVARYLDDHEDPRR